MAETPDLKSLSSRLLEQDSQVSESEYRAYREKLARSLDAARRNERIVYWVCAVSGVSSFALMFVGGSGVVGSFDPWSKDATLLSIALGAAFVTSSILFWVGLASFYSRLRPRTRQVEESLRDMQMLQLAARLDSLQRDMALLLNERMGADSMRKTKQSPPAE